MLQRKILRIPDFTLPFSLVGKAQKFESLLRALPEVLLDLKATLIEISAEQASDWHPGNIFGIRRRHLWPFRLSVQRVAILYSASEDSCFWCNRKSSLAMRQDDQKRSSTSPWSRYGQTWEPFTNFAALLIASLFL